ncbi:hypothetical protein ABZP36_008168 [Zizania latifolia]
MRRDATQRYAGDARIEAKRRPQGDGQRHASLTFPSGGGDSVVHSRAVPGGLSLVLTADSNCHGCGGWMTSMSASSTLSCISGFFFLVVWERRQRRRSNDGGIGAAAVWGGSNGVNLRPARMEEMDYLTFPTTAAAADTAEALRLRHRPFPASPPWFPSFCPVAAAPVAAASKDVVQVAMAGDHDDEEEVEPTSDAGSRREEEGEEGKAEAAEPLPGGAAAGGGAADDEEKMDLLWENFNEELALHGRHRVGSCPRSGAAAAGLELPEPAVLLRRHGCAPMLRASSRAAGTAQYYRRTSSWVLLIKIFRRLFVIEKTISSASRRAMPR